MRTASVFTALFLALGCSSDDGPAPTSDGPIMNRPDGAVSSCQTAKAKEVAGCSTTIGESFPCDGQSHVPATDAGTGLAWSHDPPHSGAHWGQWETDWSEHTTPVPRPKWVHNLEHGGVVLLHNCPAGCDTELAVLRKVLTERPALRLIMTPDPDLTDERFAAVAWTWVYRFDSPDLATLLCFVDQHEGNAPEDIPKS